MDFLTLIIFRRKKSTENNRAYQNEKENRNDCRWNPWLSWRFFLFHASEKWLIENRNDKTRTSKPGKGDPHVTMVHDLFNYCHYCGDIRFYGNCFGSGGYRKILVCCFFDLVRPVAHLWEAQQLLENT